MEGCPVVALLNFVLETVGDERIDEIGLVLGVDIGHVGQHAIEVGEGLLAECFVVEEVRVPLVLVLAEQRHQGSEGAVGVDGGETPQELLYFLVVGVLGGEQQHQLQLQVVLDLLILQQLPNSLNVLLSVILAHQVLLDTRHLEHQIPLQLR